MASVTAGRKYRIDLGNRHPDGDTVHIIAVIDDWRVLQKKWSRGMRDWIYKVESMSWFDRLLKENMIKDVGVANPSKIVTGKTVPWP